ncbi:hypothetical protein JOB18_025045 [Solea senegalensis]|uniref:Uncharacterized protein n=1 Tax=Solea senegalensis TaxID=28829 RepID=A0AAV6SFU0_SOLSE|nr:hypothetical protein JOB18_025045 [Solea senegalensis]KAG7516184.1 hypothetical protein JOB18_025045 [Solea senegalensis]
MVTEIAVNNHRRLTEGQSCEEADCREAHSNGKEPKRSNQRKHEPVSHSHLIVQWVSNSNQSVIGECNQIKNLHRQGDIAEEKECQAVAVGYVVIVKQEEVKDLWHQSSGTKQVCKGQVKNYYIFWSPQIMIQVNYSHHNCVSHH